MEITETMRLANIRGRFAALIGAFVLTGLSLVIAPSTNLAITDHGIVSTHHNHYLTEGPPPTLRP